MIIVTTNEVPGREVEELKGFVRGNTIQAKNVGRDILASLKTLVGGEIKEYTEAMEYARKVAIDRMVKDAESKGADAVIGFRLQSSAVMQNAAEIIAYGTAVKLKSE